MADSSKLPGTLADQILDLEFTLETGKLTEVKLGELLAAYSEAIGHFYKLKDERSKFYQEKLKRLFLNEQVKKLIGDSSNTTNKPPIPSVPKQVLRQQNRRLSKKVEQATQCAGQQAQHIIQRFQSSSIQATQRITRDLSCQKQNIMQRLQARSSSRVKQPQPLRHPPGPSSHLRSK